ncbi:MAG: hypothetical protein JJU21_10675 [Salinarimonas sp.]|nr:hypothetical protein [Salinarimonas sp.]
MQVFKTLFAHARGLPGLTLAAASALFLTPLFGLTYGVPVASAMILSGVALLLWGKLALAPDVIDGRLMAAIGVLILFAPLLPGFGAFSSWAFLMHLIAGITITGMAGYDLIRQRKAAKPDTTPDASDGAGQTT